ncbi:MAG: glycosyltransferase [bacterium]|nr:glycosyltransferase [bacterium]
MRIRILQVNKYYSPWIGGIEKIVQYISEGFSDGCFSMRVLCCNTKRVTSYEQEKDIFITRASSFGRFQGLPLSISFFFYFKKYIEQTDIIVLHHPFPLADLALLLFRPKKDIIVYYHADIIKRKIYTILFEPILQHTLRAAKKIVISHSSLLTSRTLRYHREKCVVIPFCTDTKKNRESSSEEKVCSLQRTYGRFVLFVGRLVPYKGLSYLISAVKYAPYNLVIIGEGPLEKSLRKLVRSEGLMEKVYFLPHQEEINLIQYYHAAEVFVLPSVLKNESFGIVLIEAMAAGCPLISTELGTGTSYINEHGVTGFVIKPKDFFSLGRALSLLHHDDITRIQMGVEAKKRVESEFKKEHMLSGYRDIFESCMSEV